MCLSSIKDAFDLSLSVCISAVRLMQPPSLFLALVSFSLFFSLSHPPFCLFSLFFSFLTLFIRNSFFCFYLLFLLLASRQIRNPAFSCLRRYQTTGLRSLTELSIDKRQIDSKSLISVGLSHGPRLFIVIPSDSPPSARSLSSPVVVATDTRSSPPLFRHTRPS